MKKILKISMVVLLLLIVSLIAGSEIEISEIITYEKTISYPIIINADFKKIENCSTNFWKTTEDTYDYVPKTRVCPIENKSCETDYTVYEKIGTKEVEHNKTECVDLKSALIKINDSVSEVTNWVCDYPDYECAVKNNIITCDSKRDGNGNGICNSGERCITLQITDDGIKPIENIEFERQAEGFKDIFKEFDIDCTKQ